MRTTNLKLLAFITLTSISQLSFSQQESEKIWVTFENPSDVPSSINGKLISTNSEIQSLIESFNVINVEQAVPSSRREALRKIYEIECNCDATVLSAAIENSVPALTKPEPAPKYELLSLPDDYSMAIQQDYALDLIDAEGAWAYSTGDTSTIIGISDGNYYANHEDLINAYEHLDVITTSTYYYQHGTAVAVTAAGNTNNSIGKSSIGYNCKLDLRGMNYDKVVQLSNAGRRVVNISWTSGCTYSQYVQDIINEVYDNGTILVAAAGNGSTCGNSGSLVYPAAYNHTIAVSSVGPTDNHQRVIGDPNSTHQHNSSVDLCAPGYDVGLTVGLGWYLTGNGTSFAAPYVTGTIGLMLSLKPCMTYEEVLAILEQSAVNIDSQNPGYLGMLGAGRLDAKTAVKMASMFLCPGEGGGGNNGGNNGGGNGGSNGGDIGGNIGNNLNNLEEAMSTNDNSIDGYNDEIHSRLEKAQVDQTMDVASFDETRFEVNMFPNPSINTARIMWNSNEAMTLKVVDVNGSIILQQEITAEMIETVIDIQEKGLYFIQLEKEGQQKWFGKFVRI